jgi:hypothetical protein
MKIFANIAVVLGLFTGCLPANNLFFAGTQLFPSNVPPLTFGTTQSSLTETLNNATNSAYANIATGKIGVLNAAVGGSVAPGVYEPIAQFGDTITATGPASGLAGLNLSVNITENGTTSFTNPADNFSFLWVFIFQPGTFDQTTFTTPGNILAADGYLLGQGTSPIAPALFQANNVPITATFGDGTNTIPLTLPFSTIGSNFQIEMVLGSAQLATDPNESWSTDFSHTIDYSLSADPGVSLTSASGVLPGTASVPEPGAGSLVFVALAAGGMLARRGLHRTLKQ